MRPLPVPSELTTQRVETFSDGVFAIAITLLILGIEVPGVASTAPDALAVALLDLWPSYFGYVFSFVVIGIYWANHHFIFGLYARSNHPFVLLNLLFLMTIAFLPFPTAVLAEYITDVQHRHSAMALYAFALLLPSLAWCLTWLYASHNHRLLIDGLQDRYIRHLTNKFAGSVILHAIAVLFALIHALAGLTMCIGVTLFYLLPTQRPEAPEDVVPE